MSLPAVSIFTVPQFRLESGVVLPEARLAWRIDGERDSRPPVLTCTAFSRACDDLLWLSTPGAALDPARRWILRVESLGNGRSSSPSTAPAPHGGADFPAFTHADNIALQKALLDHLGIDRLHVIVGASMGGQQAVQWAVTHPALVESAVVIVGGARTTLHGKLFVRSMMDALMSDPAFAGGRYMAPPEEGLKRLSRAWAPFALSPRFFGRGLHQRYNDTRADDVDAFLAKWERRYLGKDANDLIGMLRCWERHDALSLLGARPQLAGPRMLFLPSATDAYFHPDDVADDAARFAGARVEVIPSDHGHAAGFARADADRAFVDARIAAFLAEAA
jgi:homoserine O-acetyltransferase/O-succinyltransferase